VSEARVGLRGDVAWALLASVPDPEVPVLSVCDLGIVRDVIERADGLEIVLTPTYSGCPATEVIADSVRSALELGGLGPVTVTQRLAPAWTTDWISAEGRRKLREAGIAPPTCAAADAAEMRPIVFHPRTPPAVPCPRCDSAKTERLSAFGSTACKALYRCLACREPFEYLKPI
jgi:ring-1,2-phenylacetyl-CoA epoxidase subunit PaaD